jgi:hypothetical protein
MLPHCSKAAEALITLDGGPRVIGAPSRMHPPADTTARNRQYVLVPDTGFTES